MNSTSRILGESSQSSWPITYEFTVSDVLRSIKSAWLTYEDALEAIQSESSAKAEAIENALNIDVLKDNLKMAMNVDDVELALSGDMLNDPPKEADFSKDCRLIFNTQQDAQGVAKWVWHVENGDRVVLTSKYPFQLRVANQRVSIAIGHWLKSIGVPFTYKVEDLE